MTIEPEGAIPSPTSAGNAGASNRSSGLATQAEPGSPEAGGVGIYTNTTEVTT
jgi:hypothetical protein